MKGFGKAWCRGVDAQNKAQGNEQLVRRPSQEKQMARLASEATMLGEK